MRLGEAGGRLGETREKIGLKSAKSEKKKVRPHTLFLGVSCHFESFDTIENASIFFEKARAVGPSQGPSRSPAPRRKCVQKSQLLFIYFFFLIIK